MPSLQFLWQDIACKLLRRLISDTFSCITLCFMEFAAACSSTRTVAFCTLSSSERQPATSMSSNGFQQQQQQQQDAGGTTTSSLSSYDYASDPKAVTVRATLAGSVWKVPVQEGDTVPKGDLAVILEAMKTEVNIRAPAKFTLRAVLKAPGSQVAPGEVILAGPAIE